MLRAARPGRGFSLIELMVTITVIAVLLVSVLPSIGSWVANARLRSTAESMQNGMRLAQGEALRKSRQTVFSLTTAATASMGSLTTSQLAGKAAANGTNWFVQTLPVSSNEAGLAVASFQPFVQGSAYGKQAGVTITGPAQVCFNSMGRLVTLTLAADGSTAMSCKAATNPVEYSLTATNATAKFKVRVYVGGQVRMCNANLTQSATNPDGC